MAVVSLDPLCLAFKPLRIPLTQTVNKPVSSISYVSVVVPYLMTSHDNILDLLSETGYRYTPICNHQHNKLSANTGDLEYAMMSTLLLSDISATIGPVENLDDTLNDTVVRVLHACVVPLAVHCLRSANRDTSHAEMPKTSVVIMAHESLSIEIAISKRVIETHMSKYVDGVTLVTYKINGPDPDLNDYSSYDAVVIVPSIRHLLGHIIWPSRSFLSLSKTYQESNDAFNLLVVPRGIATLLSDMSYVDTHAKFEILVPVGAGPCVKHVIVAYTSTRTGVDYSGNVSGLINWVSSRLKLMRCDAKRCYECTFGSYLLSGELIKMMQSTSYRKWD